MLSSRVLALGRNLVTGISPTSLAAGTSCIRKYRTAYQCLGPALSVSSSFSSSSSSSYRFKSSAASEAAEELPEDEVHSTDSGSTDATLDAILDTAMPKPDASSAESSTFDRSKQGTPSPWAVFDAWGAGADIVEPLSPEMEAKLTNEAVRIPVTEEDRATLPGETDILAAYDQHLQRKSSVHFGYPYNLMFDFTELQGFMNYSINNLGDPFVPSNYQVHSRQFECAVIDFFAKLWKMEPDSYWVRCCLVMFCLITVSLSAYLCDSLSNNNNKIKPIGLRHDERNRRKLARPSLGSRGLSRRHSLHQSGNTLLRVQGCSILPHGLQIHSNIAHGRNQLRHFGRHD
jgi:hypothetical protein